MSTFVLSFLTKKIDRDHRLQYEASGAQLIPSGVLKQQGVFPSIYNYILLLWSFICIRNDNKTLVYNNVFQLFLTFYNW